MIFVNTANLATTAKFDEIVKSGSCAQLVIFSLVTPPRHCDDGSSRDNKITKDKISHRENHLSADHGGQNTRRTGKPPLYNHV